ncbi:MAG: synthetase [Gammaproteobacteria bacterium]|jgi:NAD+ synthase (glutamine-hydrolysing)|nr:synthetase [Gammaproteobacteria bacterium]
MKIGLAQYDFTVGDFDTNVKKILAVYEKAKAEKLDMLVFPELTLCGYTPEDLLLREDFLSRCDKALQGLLPFIGEIAIVIGLPRKINHQLFNAALVLQNQKIIASYAKQMLPNYGVFDEKRYFTPGEQSCVFQLTADGPKLGLLICEDCWFTEPAVNAKKAGAEILLSIHASPFAFNKEARRQAAYANTCRVSGLPLLATLLVGAQDDVCFDGGSRVLNAAGKCMARAAFFNEELFIVDINDILVNDAPVNMVIPPYDTVANIYQALVLGIRDYVQKNHFKGALLGLSGGIDSALTLMLAIDALGKENVTAVALPSRYTSELSMNALQEQVELTGVELITMSIEEMFDASLHTLKPVFQNLPVDKTEENIQARCRGILLMALSNKTGKILLTTGNKSEMAMGYATLYGDMAGGFAALKDVYKTTVFELARYRNSIQYQIPQVIIDRPPSAELAFNQKDEDSLPPYPVLDEILRRLIDEQQSFEELTVAGFDPILVKRVVKAVYQNEYKRRQAPPGIKITPISFTRDRRYPMTCGSWSEK